MPVSASTGLYSFAPVKAGAELVNIRSVLLRIKLSDNRSEVDFYWGHHGWLRLQSRVCFNGLLSPTKLVNARLSSRGRESWADFKKVLLRILLCALGGCRYLRMAMTGTNTSSQRYRYGCVVVCLITQWCSLHHIFQYYQRCLGTAVWNRSWMV